MTEYERMLLRAGAVFIRHGRKHKYYNLGGVRYTVPNGTKVSPRAIVLLRATLRKERER